MKKGICLLLAGSLMLSLCGCSTKNRESGTSVPESASAAPAVPAAEEKLEEITGRVSGIDGLVYTLQLGTMENSASAAPGTAAEAAPPKPPQGDAAPAGDLPAAPEENGVPPAENVPGDRGLQPPSDNRPGGPVFVPSGRTFEVDLAGAVIRTADGEADPDIPVSDIVIGEVITAFVDGSGVCHYVTVVAAADEVWAGMASEAEQGTAATEISSDEAVAGQTFESAGDDENALRVTDASVTLEDVTVRKSGGACSDMESGDFYGMNAALLATDGAQLTMSSCTVESAAQNGNGVFSYGSGTTVDISASTIVTALDHSGGLQTTGGASLDAHDVTVTTAGSSSAAIRSDRGGGHVTVTGGTYTTTGRNSPAVYSTAEIEVTDAQLTADGSEALVIEGENSLRLENCTVSGNMSSMEGSSSHENVHNIMIYQSMSGDAREGEGTFYMRGGSLTCRNGDMFYITNTTACIEIDSVSISNRDERAWLFNIAGNSGSLGWGSAGANGAHADITLRHQNTVGDVRVDSVSSLDFHLADETTLIGGIRLEANEAAPDSAVGIANVIIDEGCTWRLTGDCQVTTLENNGIIEFAGHAITLADGRVLTA